MLQNFMKNRRILGPVGHTEWMSYFMGIGGELEHVAFLSLWLSRYVFSTNHYCKISQDVFPIAIYLARGTRIALAPAVLASIYRDLSLLKDKIAGILNEWVARKLVLWAPFQLVQLWGWERFPTLGPSPINILNGESRLSRWRKLERPNLLRVMLDFESLGKSFVWRPYGICVENWQFPEFCGDEERLVLIDFGVGEELLSFARCLRACELLGLDCIEQYLPHRIGMQFGLDQDVPSSVPRSNESHLAAWNSYDMPLNGLKLYLSPRLLKGDVTARYSDWFRTALCATSNSVLVLKKKRSHSSRLRVTFKLSKASDGSMEGNGKRAPICPTSSFDVPVASCSTHSVGVGKMHIEDGSSYDKINIECYEGMTSQSKNKVAVVESQDFAASTEDYSKQAPVCLPSLSNVFEPPGFVSNIEVVQTAASCSNISNPDRSYVENSRCISSECPNGLNKLSKNLDVNAGKNMDPPPCIASSCNVPVSSGFLTFHDKSTAGPQNAHVDDSGCLPCQSPKKPKIELCENLEDNSKGVLPCLPSPSNVAIDSGFDDSVWEGYIESIPSCEKNNSRNTSQVDNYEVMPSQSLHVAIEEAVGEMDSQMEQVARYREKCVNMSVMRSLDSVAEKHVETVPSCDRSVSLGRICEDTPSQIMQRVCNDVEMTESEKHEELAADKIYKSKEESAKKNLGLVADDDEQDKSHKTAKDVKIKSGDGLFGDPVIINDDNDDIGAELEARISKLERKFARMKSRKLKSKAK
uniref:Aminotransferase-like plant mobile domain-containing protein n=1 Tax=Chenopodium quinoa TaxID=63459 RepID=A0A803LYD7_CHEQI